MSYSITRSETFTLAHAKNLASRVAADMHVSARYYGRPSDSQIDGYADELAQMLRYGYVDKYEFGFKKDGKRIVSWSYSVDASGAIQSDDRTGRVYSAADVSGATFFNYMWYSTKWHSLPAADQDEFKKELPVERTPADPPADGHGYWTAGEKSYSSGGVGLSRSSFRPY